MIEKIYIACCARDLWLARICVASIRSWYSDIPICLLRDQGQGRFSTRELERAWSVTAVDSEPCYSGWGYTKLELFFRTEQEKFLYVDADTVFVGPALDPLHDRTEEFIVSPDLIPVGHPVMATYYDYEKLKTWDPAWEYPGWVFNAGQFVGTSGVLHPEDFEPVVSWATPPRLNRRDLFFSADQGYLNYLLVRKVAQGALTLGTATLYYDGSSDEAAALRFQPTARDHPFILHWPGEKKPRTQLMRRGDILAYFERLYYSRVPGGQTRRLLATLGRTISYHAHRAIRSAGSRMLRLHRRWR